MQLNPFKQKTNVQPLENGLTTKEIRNRGYLSFALECLDNLIEHGTDRYGKEHHDMLVSILDVRTKNCPEFPPRTTCRIGGNIGYVPTPYKVNAYNVRDFSWGYYGAYVWQDIKVPPKIDGGMADFSFDSVNARAIAVRIKVDKDRPCGIYEIVLNHGAVKPKKAAATYSIEGAWSANSVYSDGFVPENSGRNHIFLNNNAALIDGRYPQKDGGDEGETDIPIFSFLERETDYTKDSYTDGRQGNIPPALNKKTGSDEWIMLELEAETSIESIMIAFEPEGVYAMPESVEVAWANELDYSKAEYPDYDVVPWRGEKRECYWNPRGSEFYEDQSIMHSMEAASKITGDEKYIDFIGKYFGEVLKVSGGSEEFMWGTHKFYDVFFDECKSPNGDPHEMAVKAPVWEMLWKLNSEAVRSEIEYIRKMHIVDHETGLYNRHDGEETPCCISIAGGQFIYAFSYLYSKTQDDTYLDAAKLIANMHFRAADEKTGLTPDVPSTGDGFPSHFCGTEITGTLCFGLLKSYEITGDPLFRDQALQYLRNFGKYAYDEANEKFYALANIHTGETVSGARWDAGENPLGYADLWQPYQYGFEQPLVAAQTYAFAYYLTKDAGMLSYAEKWAAMISNNPPESGCRTDSRYELYARLFSKYGTFADYYGRSISMFLNLYVSTTDDRYLAKAHEFADEAISKLYYNGLFRGHPARAFYNNVDGVGFLLYSLLQLHVLEKGADVEFNKYVDIDNY